MEEKYFFDTYALIEIFSGNNKYKLYALKEGITTYFQLYELYYSLRRDYTEEEFNDFFDFVKTKCIALDFSWIKEASEFRLQNKVKQLSYADCLGYIAAKYHGLKFLTGDKEFKDLKNVEFVGK